MNFSRCRGCTATRVILSAIYRPNDLNSRLIGHISANFHNLSAKSQLTPRFLVRLRNRPLHSLGQEGGEGLDVEIDARAVECTKIARTITRVSAAPSLVKSY
jgi:hypothetical protein